MAISLPPDAPSGPKNTTVSAAGENDSPAFPHPTYTKLKSRWEKCRALMGESEDIRAGRTAFLVEFAGEGSESYEFRLKLVALTNFFKRAVQASVGMLLEAEPTFADDMPKKIVEFAEDITLGGKHISVYAKEITSDHVVDGCVGTLVDYPTVDNPTGVDSDAEARLGLRPFFVKYTRGDILKVVYGKVNGVKQKTLVVLRETAEQLDGDFGIKNVVQYRVFRLTAAGVTWEIWESTSSGTSTERKGQPAALMVGGAQAKRIPFSLFGDFDALPLLENLADLNIEHHNVKTNMRNLEFLAMVPTQVRIGAVATTKPDGTKVYPPITLGPRSTIEAPYPPKDVAGVAKPVYWHSPDVSVLDPGNRSLQDIKSDIGTVALSFMTPDKRAAETAAAKRMDNKAERATLSSVGRGLKDHLEECAGFASEMIKEAGGSIEISLEFENTQLTSEEMRQYLDAALAGKISDEEFLEAWKRGKRLPDSLDPLAEREKILKQGVLSPEDDE